MASIELEKIKQVAIQAAQEAGEVLLRSFKHVDADQIKYKKVDGRKSPVTDLDKQAEKIIKKHIKNNFPDHDIMSEESKFEDNPSKWMWIVDPLDGTRNYINQKKYWGVSIGVRQGLEHRLGVIYLPLADKLYSAIVGQGAWVNEEKISVSSEKDLKQGVITLGSSHKNYSRQLKSDLRKLFAEKIPQYKAPVGAAVQDLINVATGKYLGLVYPDINAWDVAAGVLLILEAGGKATDLSGNEWQVNSRDLFVSNREIHDEVLELIKKALNH